ncbi:hypothetical protein [Brevibacterium permense]|uniref:Minor tail protein n=1 Tax=Brevibacterium permense TaxID=234834 RepID=A0ABP4L197_9MICO|nr:hypothetical protein [Brevibacterium permense]
MALDQAWAVGGGAENPVEGARLSTYTATNGGRGVILPDDMKVSALPTPGPFVRAVSGACVSPNDYLGEDGGGQSYTGREGSSTDIPVAPTGSSGGQTKYLIWAVHDEQYERGLTPADKVNDPRNNYEWVSSVNGLTFPHVPLVKLVQPANTATITNSMLTDIREVANPIVGGFTFARPRISEDSVRQIKLTRPFTDGGVGPFYGELFPGGDGIPNQTRRKIPARAAYMSIRADWMAISVKGEQNAWGRYWVEFGDEYREHTWASGRQYEFSTQQFGFDTSGAGTNYKESWPLMDQVYIPKKLRGKLVTFAFKAGLDVGASAAGIEMAGLGGMGMQVVFSMAPLDEDTI